EVGKFLLFDGDNFGGINELFSGKLSVRIVSRVFDFETALFSRFCADQILRKGFQGFLGAEMAKDIVGLEGLAATQGRAYKLQLGVVAAFESAIPHGNKHSGAFAHGFDRFLDVGIANLRSFDLDLQAFVGAELEFGQYFETGAKLEWTILRVFYMIDLRLRDRYELLVLDSLVDLFGNERL